MGEYKFGFGTFHMLYLIAILTKILYGMSSMTKCLETIWANMKLTKVAMFVMFK